jgi:perosamine synthetase
MGPKLPEFERAICDYVGSPYAVAVNSGTSAMQLGFIALELPDASEVIVPSFAFGAVLNVILHASLRPVFVDIDPQTFNPHPETIEAAITPRTKAILAIHTFGRPVAIDVYRDIADRHGLALIEDASEAFGAKWKGKQVGTFGDVGVLAFYPNKQITTGEGGMLLTSDPRIAERVRRLRNQGRDPSLDWCQQAEAGYSYRLADINCALGISQLQRIESTVARKQEIAEKYDKHLTVIPAVVRPPVTIADGRLSWFCYVVQVGDESTPGFRDRVFHHLITNGIGAGRYFPPLHWQPVLRKPQYTRDGLAGESPASTGSEKLAVTERVAVRSLALPFCNQLTDAELIEVRDSLMQAIT